MISYFGVFFLKEEKQKIQSKEEKFLGKVNDELHCTFKYRPSEEEIRIFDSIVGKEIECVVYAYGYNGKHSRFLIRIPFEYQRYYISDSEAHITASILPVENPFKVDNTMQYKQIPTFTIKGTFGYWIKENQEGKEYLSFKNLN